MSQSHGTKLNGWRENDHTRNSLIHQLNIRGCCCRREWASEELHIERRVLDSDDSSPTSRYLLPLRDISIRQSSAAVSVGSSTYQPNPRSYCQQCGYIVGEEQVASSYWETHSMDGYSRWYWNNSFRCAQCVNDNIHRSRKRKLKDDGIEDIRCWVTHTPHLMQRVTYYLLN
jgi:hypothetical protein